jgi:hypothetical protein
MVGKIVENKNIGGTEIAIHWIYIQHYIVTLIPKKRSDRFLSRQKIYKQNRQTVWIIVENKSIQAFMTKQFIWSFSYSLMLHRNNNIVTQKYLWWWPDKQRPDHAQNFKLSRTKVYKHLWQKKLFDHLVTV